MFNFTSINKTNNLIRFLDCIYFILVHIEFTPSEIFGSSSSFPTLPFAILPIAQIHINLVANWVVHLQQELGGRRLFIDEVRMWSVIESHDAQNVVGYLTNILLAEPLGKDRVTFPIIVV